MTVRFSNKLVAELIQSFWAALQAGEFLTDAAAVAHTHRHRGLAWLREAGGVRPRRGRDLRGRYLSFGEREEIALGLARGESMRQIAVRLGRNVSTISREVARNRDGQGRYRASTAHAQGYERASRPKPAKLRVNVPLRERVEQDLRKKYSPEQIAGRLRADFPDQPEGVDRDDLPVAVCAIPRRAAPGVDRAPANRAGIALTQPQAGATQEPHPRHGQHQPTPAGGGGPGGAGPLGGRLDHREAEPHRDWHPGGADHRLYDAAASA